MRSQIIAGRVRGKTVAITGGARGIGRSTAEVFAEAGAQIALGDLDIELAEKTAAEISNETGAQVVAFGLDVTRPESFEVFLDEAEAALGPLDIIVNNAGIMPTGLFIDEAEAMTERIIDINLRGVITGSRLAVRRFVPRRSGMIINVASLAGVMGFPALATYCATKHAVIGFSEALKAEVRDHGVGVAVVLPGVVRTELSAGASLSKWMAPIATVEPRDVAESIVAAVGGEKLRIPVPARLGVMLTVMSLLPRRIRRWSDRVSGVEQAYTQPDAQLRERYHRRITQEGAR
ncbi:MAG: SDR family oxidoreductase [Mycolicibacterium fortuitum]|uniref:SDR family oxidoreductase n=1 Tax=Mycolicibacterium fortuitum TaxID=1766 RepID=UPI0022BA1458|nr:SDR family oxidoreductase [Mycolicibacterium fortuitum]WAY19767.1 SDR family oxidoreductase [Mycolicibacterium fortuitum]